MWRRNEIRNKTKRKEGGKDERKKIRIMGRRYGRESQGNKAR